MKYHFIWRQSIALCRPIALLIFFLFCLGTANAQTTMSPLATYTMNYSYATGCRPPDWPNYNPSDGNPYCVTQSVGQIQEYNAAPGSYCVEVVNGYMPEWSSARVWSGTTTSGIRYDVPSSGSITINHTTGKLVFYSWDWYRGDNPPYYVTVNLYSGGCAAQGGDSDNDKVPDSDDKCPGTPSGIHVNKDGCPDADSDGVADSDDKCPGTPSGTQVSKDGCLDFQIKTFITDFYGNILDFDGTYYNGEMAQTYCVHSDIKNPFMENLLVTLQMRERYSFPQYPVMSNPEFEVNPQQYYLAPNEKKDFKLFCFYHRWEWIESPAKVFTPLSDILEAVLSSGMEDLLTKLSNVAGSIGNCLGILGDIADGIKLYKIQIPQTTITNVIDGKYKTATFPSTQSVTVPDAHVRLKVPTGKQVFLIAAATGLTGAALLTDIGLGLLSTPAAATAPDWFISQACALIITELSYKIAYDPPDPDFTNMNVPPTEIIPELEKSSLGPTKKLSETMLALEYATRAEAISRDRAVGAEQAGDLRWQSTQLIAAGRYATEAAHFKKQATELLQMLAPFIKETIVPSAAAVVQHLKTEGLPDLEIKYLLQRGWSEEQIANLRQELINAGTIPLDNSNTIIAIWKLLMPLTSVQSSIEAISQATQIKINSLNEVVQSVEPSVRETLDQKKAAIESLLVSEIPSLHLKAAVEEFIYMVSALIEQTNNLSALEQDLDFGYTTLMALKQSTPTTEGLLKFYDKIVSNGGVKNNDIAQSIRTKLEHADARLKKGKFNAAMGTLKAFQNEVRAQSGKTIGSTEADDLLAYGQYIVNLLSGE